VSVNGATSGGTGTVGTIDLENSSTVSPGATPGILNSSNFAFGSGIAMLSIEINGTTPGTGYDQLNVNGTVALNGLTLNASLGFMPALGDSFTIINNGGSDQIIGAFGGLPEGTFFSISGTSFRITYSGGAGSNDVVLTRADVPPTNVPPSTITSITVLSNKQALLQGAGVSNATYTIQANTNLTTTTWPNIGQPQPNSRRAVSFTDTTDPSFNKR